jgi:hypothetical protein
LRGAASVTADRAALPFGVRRMKPVRICLRRIEKNAVQGEAALVNGMGRNL